MSVSFSRRPSSVAADLPQKMLTHLGSRPIIARTHLVQATLTDCREERFDAASTALLALRALPVNIMLRSSLFAGEAANPHPPLTLPVGRITECSPFNVLRPRLPARARSKPSS